MRRWILLLLILGFAWLVFSNLDEIRSLVIALISGEWIWVAAAGGVIIVYYLVYTISFQVAYDAVGVKRNLRELVPVVFGMLFVNLVTPSGGSAGVALFVDDAARRGHSAARTMSGTILQLLADFGSLSLLLIPSLVYLSLRGSLVPYQVAGAAIQFTMTIILAVSLMLGSWHPALLARLLNGIQRLADKSAGWFHRRSFFDEGWAGKYAEELTEASRSIAQHPWHLARAFLAMISADLLAMAALYLLFLAYRIPASPGTVAVGYAVAILFWMIPITPQGVGLVEGAMTLTFISLGVPVGYAAAITLAFRAQIFWLPVVAGFLMIRRVKTFEEGLRRSMCLPGPVTEQERQRALQIVRAHGRTSQAHLALLDDKSYYFSPGGSMVPYTVCSRTAVTLGDPIGPLEDAEQAILDFLNHCRQNEWKVVFCMVESDYLDIYRREGYHCMCLGHEGVVDLRTFTLKGNAHKTLRKRFNRLTQAGYRLIVCEPPVSDSILHELRQLSDEWLEMTHSGEKRFFLARFDEQYLRGERLALVYTPEGEISAFVNLAPEYQRNGMSIDLMRHRRKFESGTMDFLFVSLLSWARENGYDTFNLGLSPLFNVNAQPHPSIIDPILHLIYKYGSFYNFKGINGFRVKFRPYWTPLYMVFPGYTGLLGTGLAVAKANSGEGETLWSYFRGSTRRAREAELENLSEVPAES